MKVFLNPGHAPAGNPDPGAVNAETGLEEWAVASDVAYFVEDFLMKAGLEVNTLQSDSLEDICNVANSWGADIFVSIHCNAAVSKYAQGTETWVCSGDPEGENLAECVQNQMIDAMDTDDRGVKIATPGENGLYVLTNTDMPAILVELAFITNADDEQLLANEDSQREFAAAIARGITDYENLNE